MLGFANATSSYFGILHEDNQVGECGPQKSCHKTSVHLQVQKHFRSAIILITRIITIFELSVEGYNSQ